MSIQSERIEVRTDADDIPTMSVQALGLAQDQDVDGRSSDISVECLEHGVWVIRNVLSAAECQSICKAASEQMDLAHGPVDTRRYRDMRRATFMCQDASELMMQRLSSLPLFSDTVTVTPEDITIHQAPMESASGVWQPKKLNECWRILQYDSGGHFSPHFDGEHVVQPGCKSLRSFMVYLNDVPAQAGGGTCFLSTGKAAQPPEGTSQQPLPDPSGIQAESSDSKAAEDDVRLTYNEESGKFVMAGNCHVRLKVRPEAGMALVFNHNMLHMGEELSQGEKWCLRTDMVYQQVEKYGEELTEADKEAQAMLRRAQEVEEAALWCPAGSAERQEKLAQAVRIYSRVRAVSPAVADAFGV